MNKPTVTAHHDTPSTYSRTMAGVVIVYPGAEITVTYEQGDTRGALEMLDRAYADVKEQITGMTTLVHGGRAED